uniref:Beta-defensin n=1 Tax=Chinchilla lanigera TaxID=34839 RepID=A0A8C2W4D5_CHILA
VSVMKSYLMIIAILLILVQKTPGGLFRSHHDRNQELWDPCELYQGMCRNSCRKDEVQHLTCLNNQKCCLKLSIRINTF